jgi:hypothetical protein
MKRKSTHATACALVAVTIASLVAVAVTGQRALAGEYHVYSCRTPAGQAAPVDGWSKSTVPANTASVVAENTCASGGALVAGLKNTAPHEVGTSSSWTWTLPKAEAITPKGITVWRAGDTEGGAAKNATYQFVVAGPTQFESFTQGECLYVSGCVTVGEPGVPLSATNLLGVPKSNIGAHLYLTAACGGLPGYMCPEGKGDPNGYSAVIYLYAADTVLEDDTAPTIAGGSVTGELASASVLSGKPSLLFTAEDSGSGVYRATVFVDGNVVGQTQLDGNGGRCADFGTASDGLPGFLYLQPCAKTASGDVQLDTTTLSNGLHRISVSVEDAAGNSTTVIDREVDIANAAQGVAGSGGTATSSGSGTVGAVTAGAPTVGAGSAVGADAGAGAGAANGSPASTPALLEAHWLHGGQPGFTGRWGRSATIVGRLTTVAGAPIAGAMLEAVALASSQGAQAKPIATPHTDADGRFTLRLSSRSSSERIALLYAAHVGDPVPAASSALELTVPASLALRVTPRVSKVGGTISFKGVVHGAPVPAAGKQLVLQARAPGFSWRTFKLLSTDRRGHFHARYRFRLPGPIVYRFRALSPRQADFPFAAGSSNVVSVRER